MAISSNTQAILLLTAPLINGSRADDGPRCLTPGSYNRLAKFLHGRGLSPSDLLGAEAEGLIEECETHAELPPLRPLLERGFQLSQAVDRWAQRSIWVLSRADAGYPKQLRKLLGDQAPPVLYGCGQIGLFNQDGFAFVGSRNAGEDDLSHTRRAAALAVRAGFAVVSGGARGVDQAAMQGAGEAGGCVIGVLADSLERSALRREHREPLMNGEMVLCSPYDPQAGFNAGHAMQRNKLIYSLASAALVVSVEYQKGGTWAGAVEQLDRLRCGPVFVRQRDARDKGVAALVAKGALVWPDPVDEAEMRDAVRSAAEGCRTVVPETLFAAEFGNGVQGGGVNGMRGEDHSSANANGIASKGMEPAETLAAVVQGLVLGMEMPIQPDDVADRLGVTKQQAKLWLNELCDAELLVRIERPVRFVLREARE